MDNRIFNVNGESREDLEKTLDLAFTISGFKPKSYLYDPKAGIILLWIAEYKGAQQFISIPTPAALSEMIFNWLKSEEAKKVPCNGWDANSDHDGDNEKGWRVYCEDWGHVNNCSYSIVAVKPAYTWYGK